MVSNLSVYEALRPLKKLRRVCVDLLAVKTLEDVTHRFAQALAHAGGESILSKLFLETTGISLAASVRKAMTKLVDKRIVHKIGTAYRFCDPFFAAWLRGQPV